MPTIDWKCSGCGIVSADRVRRCDCITDCLYHYEDGKMTHELKIEPETVAACALADKIAEKKSGHRSFPSLDAEVNLGWVTEVERDLIVKVLRAAT
jgi:hypothetical protein